MQYELDLGYPDLDFQILGVNEFGHESGNDLVTPGTDLPWLQDADVDLDGSSDVWTSWDVDYRDVVILDATNTKVGVFNLTSHGLQEPDNYNSLRNMLVEAAVVPEPSTLVLLAMAVVGLLAYGRNKRKV